MRTGQADMREARRRGWHGRYPGPSVSSITSSQLPAQQRPLHTVPAKAEPLTLPPKPAPHTLAHPAPSNSVLLGAEVEHLGVILNSVRTPRSSSPTKPFSPTVTQTQTPARPQHVLLPGAGQPPPHPPRRGLQQPPRGFLLGPTVTEAASRQLLEMPVWPGEMSAL